MQSRRRTHRNTQHRSHSRTAPRGRISFIEGTIVVLCAIAVILTFTRAIAEPAYGDITSVPIRVEASQTLWGLAGEHPIEGMTTAQTVEYIQRINSRKNSNLLVGEVILVPQVQDHSTAMASN